MEYKTLDFLTERQKEFLLLYSHSNNISKACKAVGISRTTAYEYLKNEVFCKALNEFRKENVTSAWYLLSTNLENAVNRLVEILNSKNTTTNAKLRAIQLLFEYTEKYQDRVEIIDRVKALEAKFNVG